MDRFKYSVTPFSPIKDLIAGQSIRTPFSADLDKDEVFLCMKHGPVYRLFPGKAPIKVTGSNFEQLHRAKYEEIVEEKKPLKITTVEAPKIVEQKVVEEASIKENVNIFDRAEMREELAVETSSQEEVVPIAEDEEVFNEVEEVYSAPVEETVSEEVTESEDVEEDLPNEYNELESSEETSVEASEYEDDSEANPGVEEVVTEEAPVEEKKPVGQPQYKPNYNGGYSKKKKHKNH